jgi:hypothetical protein
MAHSKALSGRPALPITVFFVLHLFEAAAFAYYFFHKGPYFILLRSK